MAQDIVGILALQGDFELHRRMFARLGAEVRLVRSVDDLRMLDRLVIPGGESTTMQLLIDRYSLRESLIEFGHTKPIWGTCAGLILLSKTVDDSRIRPLELLDIASSRNAYGRQVNSFVEIGNISVDGSERPFEMVFIRAPKILRHGDTVLVLGRLNREVTMAGYHRVLVTAFHPELTDDPSVHKYFLSL
jgi:5'-phosphate synthase pdxT subunit